MAINQWADALQIKSKEIAAWQADAPKGVSFLYWCLKTAKVDAFAYFDWAKNQFGLPFLLSDFFDQTPDMSLWNGIKSVANWSPEMLPVSQWDGVIFIACVEPPTDIQWSFPVRYVLAHPEDLNRYWETLSSIEQPAAQPAPVLVAEPVIEMPEIPKSDPEVTAAPTAAPTFDVPEGFNFTLPDPATLSAENAPEGLGGATKISFSQAEPAAPEVPTEEPKFEAPEGFKLSLPETKSVPAAEPVMEVPPEMTAPPETPTVSKVLNLNLPPPAQAGSNIVAFPPEPTHAPELTQSASAHSNADFTEITRIAGSLDFLKQDFESSMILVYRNETLKPLIWDSSWKPVGEGAGPKNLLEPSAFRIVMRTKNPYLGHIVDTPVNRQFFNNWNMKELPLKVLIQPLFDKQTQELLGMFVSVCNNSLRNQTILAAGEKHSAEILRLMKDSQASAA